MEISWNFGSILNHYWRKDDNSYMPNYYINNRNLERFLSFWFENEQHICADEECGVSCTYCDSFYRNNIIGKE